MAPSFEENTKSRKMSDLTWVMYNAIPETILKGGILLTSMWELILNCWNAFQNEENCPLSEAEKKEELWKDGLIKDDNCRLSLNIMLTQFILAIKQLARSWSLETGTFKIRSMLYLAFPRCSFLHRICCFGLLVLIDWCFKRAAVY